MPAKPKSRLLEFALTFAIVYLLTQLVMRMFFPQLINPEAHAGIQMSMLDATVKDGHHPTVIIQNHTEEDILLPSRCPLAPIDMYRVAAGVRTELTTEETIVECPTEELVVEAGGKVQIDLAPWKHLFSEFGEYIVVLPVEDTEESVDDEEGATEIYTEFTTHKAGMFTQAFRAFVSKPLLNLLVLIASLLPGHSLGWAIVLLTLIVKLLLFVPTQHAMEGQKKMQALQPKIDAIRKKYKDNPQMLHQETMELWKKEGVNPFQTMVPMLIQFPVLIGLFFVIRDGSSLALSQHLLYPLYQDISWVFGTDFFGLDLLEPSKKLMPILLFVLQFGQLKLSFAAQNKKAGEKAGPQPMQQKIMLYALPLMIAVFAVQFPAAVSLYWGISTIFALGQQLVVNKRV